MSSSLLEYAMRCIYLSFHLVSPESHLAKKKKKILNNYCKSLHLGTRSLTLSIIFFSDFSDLIPNLGMHFPTRSTHTRDLVKGCEHFVVYIL